VHDGALLTARGYGWADTGADGGDPVPVDPERTLFRPGSVSKLVTATAVLQLVQSGDVDLDTDVAAYLDFEVPRAFDEPITLRHLLTHTAGFEERVGGLIGAEGTPVDLRAALAGEPPEQVYRPGTVPAYSNYGNSLAGYVVEHVSGQPFEEYVRDHVLEPAGMTSATFEQPVPEHLRDRLAEGYATSSSPSVGFEVVGTPPAGALSASATDMAAFMLAQLGEPITGQQVLDADTRALMQEPALDAGSLGTLADGPRMTLGFFQEDRNGHRIVGHGGDTQFFHSHLQLYPDERTGIFVSVNGSGEGAMDSLELREQLMHGFADRYFPAVTSPGETARVDEATASTPPCWPAPTRAPAPCAARSSPRRTSWPPRTSPPRTTAGSSSPPARSPTARSSTRRSSRGSTGRSAASAPSPPASPTARSRPSATTRRSPCCPHPRRPTWRSPGSRRPRRSCCSASSHGPPGPSPAACGTAARPTPQGAASGC
jgi:CubicO group peptidase (beta-lactamase class C family)